MGRPALAENTPPPVAEVVVTATRSARALTDVPASISVVTSEQIEDTPGRTIDDILRRSPSVDLPIASTNEQHPTDTIVSLRGLSGVRALVLLDGVPLHDPFFGYVQWSEVPLETVDRVEVVRGGGATLWGNYALGGVINIITKPIDKTEFVAEAAGGGRGTYRSDGHAAYAGNGFGLGLDAGVSHSDGYVEQVESARGAITVPTGFTAHTLAISGDAALAPSLSTRGRVSFYDNDQNFLTRLNTNRQVNWRYTGSVNWKPYAGASVDLSGFHNDSRFTTNNTFTPDGFDATQAEFVQNTHRTRDHDEGASLIWTQAFPGVLRSVSAGVDYHGVHGRDAASIFDETGAFLRADVGAGDQRFLGAFTQFDLRPVERLQVLFSLRYQDFRNYNGVDDTPGGLGAAVPSRRDSDVDPRLSIRYALPYGFALRGAGYRAFRAPTLDNLYRSASVPGYILNSNASLAPETLNGGEIGFDFSRGPVRFQATAYDSYISDLITYRTIPADALPTGFTQGARLINAGSARSYGAEAELDWRLTPTLEGTLAYTFADSVVTSNPDDAASVGVQQSGIPRNRVSAGMDWTVLRGVKISPRLQYVARTNGDPDGAYHTDPHLIVDVAMIVPLSRRLEGFVQVENLLDRRYIGTNDGFTAALYGKPLTAVVGLRLKLGPMSSTPT